MKHYQSTLKDVKSLAALYQQHDNTGKILSYNNIRKLLHDENHLLQKIWNILLYKCKQDM